MFDLLVYVKFSVLIFLKHLLDPNKIHLLGYIYIYIYI